MLYSSKQFDIRYRHICVKDSYPAIRFGVYQGDVLSPLLFCIGLNPLSHHKEWLWVSGPKWNNQWPPPLHGWLYAKNKHDIDFLIHLTRIYSKDIGMSFGLHKCGRMISRRGTVITTDGVELPEGNITDVQDSYEYLGIPQANGNHEEAARRSATAKYLQRLRQVLKSQLNGKHKIQAINTYTLPVIRYPAGIIPWPLEEIQEETTSLREYIKKMAPTDPLLSECLRQQKPTKEEEPERLSWKDKPIHGMYHRQIEEVADIEKTYQWLTNAGLKDSTEALLTTHKNRP
ncbi:hypothetical protein D4764_13G0012600 [Takifugu flavidus]|uniref:Reverse transcriptase domain-containing protein n=1 Tax=Takifugu flavidus TaxID=433684 RepID=A0A5C6PDA0_9TELE|nr:hypothetical protein D4764_13G0012600 [Takifugu flavidus]